MSDETETPNESSPSSSSLVYSNFCGKSQHEVQKLIAGPNTFICDECVDLCNDILVMEAPLASNVLDTLNKLVTNFGEVLDKHSKARILQLQSELSNKSLSPSEFVTAVNAGITDILKDALADDMFYLINKFEEITCDFCTKAKSEGFAHGKVSICKKCISGFDEEDSVNTCEDTVCNFCEETKLKVFVGVKASICTDCKSRFKKTFSPTSECTADEID